MSLFLDIINLEYAIGENILTNNTIKITEKISRVCKIFNNIVKDDMVKYYNKYIKRMLLKKIDYIITNKMYTMIKNNSRNNSNDSNDSSSKYIYKTVEEYDEELHKISKQINNLIYEEIISDLQTIYNEYIFDGSISNSCYEVYLFGIMEIEYFKLIKYLKNNNKYTLST
jgi:hypothetical protein